MAFDFKAATPGSAPASSLLFGADSMVAANPSVYTSTGSGSVVMSDSPTLVTPALGTPSSGTLANCTGLPVGSITGLGTGVATALAINVGSAGAFVTFNGALGTPSSGTLTSCTGLPISTGVSGLGTGVATFLATPSSANLAAAVTDETGTGPLVFANSPTFTDDITLGTQQTTQGAVILANTAAGAFPTTIKSSNSASAAWTLTLPTTAGTNNYVLKTDGSGNTSWVAQSGGGGSPGGNSGQYQYNNAGAFGGIGQILFADTTYYVRVNLGTVTMTIASPCVVSLTAHGLSNDDPVVFSTTGALPTGLTAGTVYYVVNAATDTFEVAATVGGASINTSGSQSGTHTVATGNDSNNGLAATRAGAWLTPQHAANVMGTVDANTYSAIIQIADSTYLGGGSADVMAVMNRPHNAKFFGIYGNAVTPGNVVFDGVDQTAYGLSLGFRNDVFALTAGVIVDEIKGIRFKNATAGIYGGNYSNNIYTHNVEFQDNLLATWIASWAGIYLDTMKLVGTQSYICRASSFSSAYILNLSGDTGATFNGTAFELFDTSIIILDTPDYTNIAASGGATQWTVDAFCKLNTGGVVVPGAAGTTNALGLVI